MSKRSKAMIYATMIGLIIVAIFLGFLSSITNPVSWLLVGVLLLVPFLYQNNRKSKQLVWKEEYSVGVEILDKDHKKLIMLLNQFTTAYDYAMSEEYERHTLEQLIDYTKYHFTREESLLSESNYGDIDAHKKQHRMMIDEVERFVKLYDEQGHAVLAQVSDFLSRWLINHINGTDKEYSEHLNSHGIK